MAPIKVGLIGYGSSVKVFHLPFILPNPDLDVYAFLQRAEAPRDKSNVASGKHCTVDHPNAKHYRTAKDFFGDAGIELVIVCTGHDSHAELAEQALQTGKHVVVEKPFTITSAEADNLIALAAKQNKILTCYQNRRYDSDFRTVENYIKQGVFGRITEFANHYDVDNPSWIHSAREPGPGDGLLYGLGSHSIDQTLQLFGLPKSVTAFSRTLLTRSDDSFTIILQYDGEHKDLISTIKTTVVAPIEQAFALKYWVRGTKGVFIKNGEDCQIEQLIDHGLSSPGIGTGIEPERFHGYLTTREDIDLKFEKPSSDTGVKFDGKVPSKQGSYLDYYRDVVAAVRGEKEVAVKPEESRNVIRLIELANESVEKGVTIAWS